MKQGIFHFGTFSDVHEETQRFEPGFGGDDFHLHASSSNAVQSLTLKNDGWAIEHQLIRGIDILSGYKFIQNGEYAYLFQLGGLYFVDLDKKKVLRSIGINHDDLSLNPTNFLALDPASGDLFALMDHTPRDNSIQLHRFNQDLKSNLVIDIPEQDGRADIIPLKDAFIVCPPLVEPDTQKTSYRVLLPNATPYSGALPQVLTALRQAGIRLVAPPSPDWGMKCLWATSITRQWALFSNLDAKAGPSSRTWVLTLADSAGKPSTSPVVFDHKHPFNEEIKSLILSPTHDLFIATVGDHSGETDSVSLWLGQIQRKDGAYYATNYRIRPFKGVDKLALSRDGSTIVFFTFHENKWQIAGARLADLLADINRRYPDAKLDLNALKAEVK